MQHRFTRSPEIETIAVHKIGSLLIVVETSSLLENPDAYRDLISSQTPYGDGRAAERTIQAIKYYFKRADRPEDVKSPTQVRSAPIAIAR